MDTIIIKVNCGKCGVNMHGVLDPFPEPWRSRLLYTCPDHGQMARIVMV